MKEDESMSTERRLHFCSECREESPYNLVKEYRSRSVKGKNYTYETMVAYCNHCGEEMNIPKLIDAEVEAFDKAYREMEGIVSKEDIKKLTKMYNIGKTPLSYALGFGEVTIGRYLDGQVPSKEYSDIMKKSLTNPEYMGLLLETNREKVGEVAYAKAKKRVEELAECVRGISREMICAISYIFEKIDEVTPLALQKLLYFSQGICFAVKGSEMFPDDCEAWVHGPVYQRVYELFRDFGYNPIEDDRFVLFSLAEDGLSDEKKTILDIVINSFGMYSGKVLEKITHNEEPWITARCNYEIDEPSQETISKENIREYFSELNKDYKLDDVDCVKLYIQNQLNI